MTSCKCTLRGICLHKTDRAPTRHHIYFEKIHPSVPMIHKYRYLAAMNLYVPSAILVHLRELPNGVPVHLPNGHRFVYAMQCGHWRLLSQINSRH